MSKYLANLQLYLQKKIRVKLVFKQYQFWILIRQIFFSPSNKMYECSVLFRIENLYNLTKIWLEDISEACKHCLGSDPPQCFDPINQ